MLAERLFLEILHDIEELATKGDDYSMLKAAACLRQLLLDGDRLADRVNRETRLTLQFPVCGRAYAEEVFKDDPTFACRLGGIHSSGPLGHQCENLTLKDFLAARVLKLRDQVLTVKDLIQHSSNVLGGVHSRAPETDKEQTLSEFARSVSVGDRSLNAAQMKPIILVVLDGLAPLRAAIAAKADTGFA